MNSQGSVKSLFWLAGGIALGLLLSLVLIFWGNSLAFLFPQARLRSLGELGATEGYFPRRVRESLADRRIDVLVPLTFADPVSAPKAKERETNFPSVSPEDQTFWAWDDFLSQRFQTESEGLAKRIEERFSPRNRDDFGTDPSDFTSDLFRLAFLAVSSDDGAKLAHLKEEVQRGAERLAAYREEVLTRSFRQLTLRWEKLKKSQRWDESFWDELEDLAAERERLKQMPTNNPALIQEGEEWSASFLAQRERLRQFKPFLLSLQDYDALCLDSERAKAFLLQKAKEAPESLYASDFTAAASAWDVFPLLQRWNQFVEADGEELTHFSVTPQAAYAAVSLYVDEKERLAFLPEWGRLTQRMAAFSVTAREISFQEEIEKILDPWTSDRFVFVPSSDRFFYLEERPHLGENRYQADFFGQEKAVTLTQEDAESERILNFSDFFNRRLTELSEIPDALRLADFAAWFDRYGELLKKIKENDSLDPLLRFFLLKDIKEILASGDYYFAQESAVWDRYFQTPGLENSVDYFDSENESVRQKRRRASEILTTFPINLRQGAEIIAENMDAEDEAGYALYEPVGWLDADLTGVWFFRPARHLSDNSLSDNDEKPSGKLYLFLPADVENNSLAGSRDSEISFRSLEIGEMKEGIGEVNLISDDLKRGFPVFCRIKNRTVQ